MNTCSIADLKQQVARPDLVEMWDVTAADPKLLVHLKGYRNTVPVPRHWNQKRKYLQVCSCTLWGCFLDAFDLTNGQGRDGRFILVTSEALDASMNLFAQYGLAAILLEVLDGFIQSGCNIHACVCFPLVQNKRGIEKLPFQLPHFIAETGIMEMRAALQVYGLGGGRR